MNASIAASPVLTTETISAPAMDRDELLQISRRIDWRFLLPDPVLGKTAYIGELDPTLINSLRQFCSCLVLLDGEADAEQCSLAVARNPSIGELTQAAHVTRDGGYVYIEVSRGRNHNNSVRTSQPLSGVATCLEAMRRLHLSELQAHWHWPDFESCNEIIPLQDANALACALRRRGSGWRSRWKSAVGLLLLKCHLVSRLVPCFSVLGQRHHCPNKSTHPAMRYMS